MPKRSNKTSNPKISKEDSPVRRADQAQKANGRPRLIERGQSARAEYDLSSVTWFLD